MTQTQFDFLLNKAKEIMEQSTDKVHDWSHAARVIENAKLILARLPEKQQIQIDEKILILCCAWHDVSHALYKIGFIEKFLEGRRSAKIINIIFSKQGVKEVEKFVVMDAAIAHAMKEFKFLKKSGLSLYHKIMQDADMLDNFYPARVEHLEAQVKDYFYARFVVKFLKPIFYRWMERHINLFLNLKESLMVYEKIKNK
ncbi:MAG TPA: HD domain-containing protein [bacterium]|nr:HD domain-containing protein [bacterium]HPL95594.1 HD domain-containing protein [bacterium]